MDLSMNTVEQCQSVTRRYATTFYFASHALPPEKRRAAYTLYALCRDMDTMADESVMFLDCRV